MIAADLIALLQQLPPSAEVFAIDASNADVTEMCRIAEVGLVESTHYGTAILIELED